MSAEAARDVQHVLVDQPRGLGHYTLVLSVVHAWVRGPEGRLPL
ncbi:hypothetical protein [Vitiosangium sp. GDMCC 1.1324]|nr:hypothetical protein [Vitiosangium sp. GDMCC 1.1324]